MHGLRGWPEGLGARRRSSDEAGATRRRRGGGAGLRGGGRGGTGGGWWRRAAPDQGGAAGCGQPAASGARRLRSPRAAGREEEGGGFGREEAGRCGPGGPRTGLRAGGGVGDVGGLGRRLYISCPRAESGSGTARKTVRVFLNNFTQKNKRKKY